MMGLSVGLVGMQINAGNAISGHGHPGGERYFESGRALLVRKISKELRHG